LGHLVFWSRDCHSVACLLRAGEVNLAIPFLFEFFDFRQAGNQFSVVESVDYDSLGDKFGVL